MMNAPVSVIIPTHNRCQALSRAIQSVLKQSFERFELIVVSDASTDGTDNLVKKLSDSRIIYIRRDMSGGASAARNEGLRVAKGNYIAFLDDDDEWVENALDSLVQKISNSEDNVGLVYGWMDYVMEGKVTKQKQPRLKGDIFYEILDKQPIGNSSVGIIKKEVLSKVVGFDERLKRGNDGDFWRRICKYYRVDYIPKTIAKIHVENPDRISLNNKTGLRNHVASGELRLKKFADEFRKFPECKANVLWEIFKAFARMHRYANASKVLLEIVYTLGINYRNWSKFLSKLKRKI
ncbi:MAG: glycosyltransferase [Chitinivibrionales bacterium]|nr:glycosyltransferase [Chitinivibrionales bacterium]